MKIRELYTKIKNNKLLTALVVSYTIGAVTMLSAPFTLSRDINKLVKSKPIILQMYDKTNEELKNLYEKPIQVRYLLNQELTNPLVNKIKELENKKNNLESLPDFTKEKNDYENKMNQINRRQFNRVFGGFSLGIISTIVGGYITRKRRRLNKKWKY